jgi:hypothetical protein
MRSEKLLAQAFLSKHSNQHAWHITASHQLYVHHLQFVTDIYCNAAAAQQATYAHCNWQPKC